MSCLSRWRSVPQAPSGPAPDGLTPSTIRTAYGLPRGDVGPHGTIAVVVAYDAVNVAADLAVYRQTFGLPRLRPNQIRVVGQTGGPRPSTSDFGWSMEAAIDTQMATASCSACALVVVEASSDALSDVAAAERTALNIPGVVAVSNSFGLPEEAESLQYESSFGRAGTRVFAAAGDYGPGALQPAAFPRVVAVGATSLLVDETGRRVREAAWSGTGSGCSAFSAKPVWQRDRACRTRTIADVAAVGDPDTGVAAFLTYDGFGEWFVAGGTSVSTPLVAGMHARSGSRADSPYGFYRHPEDLYDVRAGATGDCNPALLCLAGAGYDGPSGNGSPLSLQAFY